MLNMYIFRRFENCTKKGWKLTKVFYLMFSLQFIHIHKYIKLNEWAVNILVNISKAALQKTSTRNIVTMVEMHLYIRMEIGEKMSDFFLVLEIAWRTRRKYSCQYVTFHGAAKYNAVDCFRLRVIVKVLKRFIENSLKFCRFRKYMLGIEEFGWTEKEDAHFQY